MKKDIDKNATELIARNNLLVPQINAAVKDANDKKSRNTQRDDFIYP